MKPILELRFTELGALALSALCVYAALLTLLSAQAFGETLLGDLIELPILLFSVPFIFYVLFRCARAGHWLWLIGGLLFIPLQLVYWWRYIRPELSHDAQQRAPADPPRPAGSAGG